jgi:hypothetical protein
MILGDHRRRDSAVIFRLVTATRRLSSDRGEHGTKGEV